MYVLSAACSFCFKYIIFENFIMLKVQLLVHLYSGTSLIQIPLNHFRCPVYGGVLISGVS